MPLILILIVAAAFTKAIFSHRENMESIRQGSGPIRKSGPKATGGGPAAGPAGAGSSGAASSGPKGPFLDYASTLWGDLWEDAKKRHERERQAKRPDGGRRVRDV